MSRAVPWRTAGYTLGSISLAMVLACLAFVVAWLVADRPPGDDPHGYGLVTISMFSLILGALTAVCNRPLPLVASS